MAKTVDFEALRAEHDAEKIIRMPDGTDPNWRIAPDRPGLVVAR